MERTFRGKTYTSEQIAARRRRAGRALLLTAVISLAGGATAGKYSHSEERQPAPYTTEWLDGRPHQIFKVGEGQGSLDAVRAVEPEIANQAWQCQAAEDQLRSVEAYIENQSTNGNKILQLGQTVLVPVVEPVKC